MRTSFILRSWLLLLIAVLSWCGVAFLVSVVIQMQSERVQYAADAAQANLQQGQAAQLRVLARETEGDRKSVMDSASIDLLSAVNLIESINVSGTPVKVVNAQTAKTVRGGSLQLNVVDLTVNSQGSFATLMQILQLLETVPLAAAIQEVHFSHIEQEGATKVWQLTVKLRFYTTATLST